MEVNIMKNKNNKFKKGETYVYMASPYPVFATYSGSYIHLEENCKLICKWTVYTFITNLVAPRIGSGCKCVSVNPLIFECDAVELLRNRPDYLVKDQNEFYIKEFQ